MVPDITSFADFSKRLDEAIDRIDKLFAVDDDPMYGSIQRQLRFVKQWTAGGVRPAQDDLDKLTFGQMASRALDDTDRNLAEEMYELADYLLYWPKDEPIRQ